ncbi:MAG: ChbG/HpnK family deacetylase [Oscillospiraceae bacterium]|nr:ChbG/HpnK family deacetylase [Oscillospiraceae bacterium]
MTEFHADDYGLFPTQSQRILDCYHEGVLNGVSVMPNSPWLPRCMEMLEEQGARPLLSVHLNLMEDRCLSPKEEVPLLVDGDGVFRVSFGRLLLARLSPRREAYKRQLKAELRAQIAAAAPYLERAGAELRLDGHAHWHMLPLAFDALMELIAEEALPVRYIRIPMEPLSVYLRHGLRIFPFHPINVVKTLILRLLSKRALRRWGRELAGMEQKVFLGVLFSDHFSYEKMRMILPDAEAYAAARGMGLELLAHPGAVLEPEDIAKLTNRDDRRFLTSEGRRTEAEAFVRLREELETV